MTKEAVSSFEVSKDAVTEVKESRGEKGCSPAGLFWFMIGLFSGTFSALVCKMAYDTTSIGLDGTTKAFAKPITMLLLMFFSMTPAGIFYVIGEMNKPVNERWLLHDDDGNVAGKVNAKLMSILVVPSVCDLFCTLLLLIAQLYITASMWQLMRGSVAIVTALLKRYVMLDEIKPHMWSGLTIITVAMVVVGSTSLFGSQDANASAANKNPIIGIVLVLVGCCAQGVQYVFEEKVLKIGAPPLLVIGCEGVWGTIITLFIVYPLAYHTVGSDNGSYENPYDAIAMIRNSNQLFALAVAFVLTVTVYNCAAIYVTKYLSALWHTILDNFRPISIWGFDLAICYVFLPGQGYGEIWTNASWLQLFGVCILFYGTAVYEGRMNKAEHVYAPIGADGVITKSSATPANMSISALTNSPHMRQQPGERASALANERKTEASKLIADKRGQKPYSKDIP